ncbi:LysR substrate-binding domain-containing protein [Polymorphobacter multimanifer]|uniref:LysR substrate-binding domain-containing protein n=1 Tax=Polymorphobacter multimanifer TaxID=1070431 RepID=UPI001FB0DBFA|nr:LysR substrate-binding domain-containing protein [Polymorphobacter multimanifer]
MQLIADFQHRHPGVSVTIRTATTPDAARLVINDEAHMAVIFTMAGEPRLRTRVSMAQPLHAVCAPDHPAARSQGLTLADLARHTLCLPPNGFRIRQVLAAAEIRQHLRFFCAPSSSRANRSPCCRTLPSSTISAPASSWRCR